MSNNTGNNFLAVMVGIAIGAGLGILYAPDEGSKTRKKVKDGIDDSKNDMYNKFDAVASQLGITLADAKIDLEETYENMISNVSYKTEDVILFLEGKLANLKKQNAKHQK
jgi:gas vesicle protein